MGRDGRYETNEVLCPFYKYENGSRIYCEGLYKDCGLNQSFPSDKQKRKHKDRYCVDINGFKTCPVYIAANKKYEANGNG